jgi:hypothetical protein
MPDTTPGDRGGNYDNLRNWAVRGAGAAKFRWGTKGSHTRCVREIQDHVGVDRAHRICATWEHQATGSWPNQKKKD